jgi:hypothetical protein
MLDLPSLPQSGVSEGLFIEPDAPNPDSDDKSDGRTRVQRGGKDEKFEAEIPADGDNPAFLRRLTPEEKAILIGVCRKYWDIRMVRRELAAEYPDFPNVTDRTLREYRKRAHSGKAKDADKAVQEVLKTGVADKATRITYWQYGAFTAANNIITRKLIEVNLVTGVEIWQDVYDKDASREMRENLKGAAQEMGVKFSGSGKETQPDPAAPGQVPVDGPEAAADLEDVKQQITDIFSALVEQKAESDAVWAATEPPEGIAL